MEVLAPSRKPPEFPTHLSVNAYGGIPVGAAKHRMDIQFRPERDTPDPSFEL